MIILTHDTGRGNGCRRAIAQMQALPTVLAKIVRIRKEELSVKYVQHARRRRRRRAAVSRRSCSRVSPPTAGCTCPSAIRRSTPRRSRAGATCRIRDLAFEVLSRVRRRHPGRRPARADRRRPTASRRVRRRCADHAAATARARRLRPAACRTVRRSRSRTWRCSCSATLFEYELARRGAALNVLGATSGDTGSAAEYAMRGKRGVARLHALAARPDEPVPAGADVQPAGRRTSTTSRSRACSTTARTSSRRSRPTSRSSAHYDRHGQLDQLGARRWRRSSTTSRATSRRRSGDDEAVEFAVPSGNFGNICAGHVARRMGLPIRAPGARDQRERRARRVLPHRRLPRAQRRRDARDVEPVDGHLEGVELRALRLRSRSAATRRACGRCSRERRARTARSISPARASCRARRASSASCRDAARTPTAWRRSATCTSASATVIDTHTADGAQGRARARASRACR